ncbi:DUF5916 domain-containing protein [Thalassotalea fonticola]|uniref:DUF5916 domain-containing protein n=1 Tax=Thalassotalea fonticola TaxID=3065649 RepID=A0ABZ0GL44_9GAMM|nr:DUF5916 domain-containing protein [Colwelliaceae bacterium S1-1]
MKAFSKILLSLLFTLIICGQVYAENIEVDGELEESIWQNATVIEGFKITHPLSLATPPNQTQVLVASDEMGIYIGFINYQQDNESIVSNSLNDADINTDYNEVIIDFDAQGIRAYGFKVSRTGAIQDSIWSDENRESTDWNGEWQHGVEIEDDEGFWSTEIFIPWSIAAMVSTDKSSRIVNLYFSRFHQGKNMRFSFPAIERTQKTFVGNFQSQQLVFKESSKLDFFPYVAYNRDLEHHKDDERFGADLFWKISSSQQLNFTLNPDFGQVESDELVVNFSEVETFFSEKRPFFRENHDVFDMQGPENLILVHTPRIGGEADDEDITSTDIDGAGRYTYIGKRFDIGLFSAFEEDTNFADGREYFAARIQYKKDDFRLGLLQTHTERPVFDRQSDVTAFDFQWEVIDELQLSGQFISTNIEQNLIEETSLTDYDDDGWWLGIEWEPSEQTSHELAIIDYGRFLDLSDFGFVERVNRQKLQYEGSYEWTQLSNNLRDIEWEWLYQYNENEQDDDLPSEVETELIVNFNESDAIELELEYREEGIHDTITRGNNPVLAPEFYKAGIKYISEQNNFFTYEISYATGEDYLAGDFYEIEFIPIFQINDNADLSFEFEWIDNDSWLIWDEENVLEEFKREELSIALNINAVFSERHELRLKIESVALEAVAINEYEAEFDGALTLGDEPPDSFSLSEFAAQVRYRYEISALSELYIVYSRAGEFEQERIGFQGFELMNKSINRVDDENFLVKIKLHL